MANLRLQDVCKLYPGGVKAVDRVNLTIRDGEMVVLVGPSGCGKSTTLRMIAGLEEISSGTISIGDRVVNEVAPKDRDIAMVFQNYALYPHKNVYENMAFSLRLRRRELGLSRADIDRKVRETAATLGLDPLLERKPRALSGGQRQRVAVGRAIVRNPKAFLFDEPLSNLDARLRLEMRAELKRLHRRLATTTIYVTHDQEEAMTLGDRIVVMKDGLVQQVAEPLEVYARPVNRFVAGFVGSPPMNFLSGQLKRSGGGIVFDEGSQTVPLPARMAERVAARVDQPMVLGIRPEALHPAGANAMGSAPCARCGQMLAGRFCHACGAERGDVAAAVCLRGKISVVEPLGEVVDIAFSTAAHSGLMARVDARAGLREGQEVTFSMDMDGAHLFEPGELGVNLTLAP